MKCHIAALASYSTSHPIDFLRLHVDAGIWRLKARQFLSLGDAMSAFGRDAFSAVSPRPQIISSAVVPYDPFQSSQTERFPTVHQGGTHHWGNAFPVGSIFVDWIVTKAGSHNHSVSLNSSVLVFYQVPAELVGRGPPIVRVIPKDGNMSLIPVRCVRDLEKTLQLTPGFWSGSRHSRICGKCWTNMCHDI
jgi:hypothetical protein